MSKHTPGPWRIEGGRLSEKEIAGANGHNVIDLKYPATEVSMADAALIAAAPELLEALRVAYRSLGVAAIRDDADRRASALDVIRAAILKAEGRES